MGAWVTINGNHVFIENAHGPYAQGEDGQVRKQVKIKDGRTVAVPVAVKKSRRGDVDENNIPHRVPDNLKQNTSHYEEFLGKAAQARGISREELAKELQDKAETVTAGAHVFVRVPPLVLARVLEAGRFKSQVETRRSSGTYAPGKRVDFEARFFGTKEGEARPIYGYLDKDENGAWHENSPAGENDSLGMYGAVAVRLKTGVHARTTWTGNDSLEDNGMFLHVGAENGGNPRTLPSYLDAPSGRSLPVAAGRNIGPATKAESKTPRQLAGRYLEAQIHGGVTTKDIDEVVFYRKQDHAKYAGQLSEKGIKSRLVDNPYKEKVGTYG